MVGPTYQNIFRRVISGPGIAGSLGMREGAIPSISQAILPSQSPSNGGALTHPGCTYEYSIWVYILVPQGLDIRYQDGPPLGPENYRPPGLFGSKYRGMISILVKRERGHVPLGGRVHPEELNPERINISTLEPGTGFSSPVRNLMQLKRIASRPVEEFGCDYGNPHIQKTFEYYYEAPDATRAPCEGSYTVELKIKTIGGQISPTRITKLLERTGPRQEGGKGFTPSGHGIPTADGYKYRWNSQKLRCGIYEVSLTLPESPLLIPQSPPKQSVTISEAARWPIVTFHATYNVSPEGGGQPPGKGGSQQQAPYGEATPFDEESAGQSDAYGQGEVFLNGDQSSEFPFGDLESSQTARGVFQPHEPGEQIAQPGTGSDQRVGPPWTQMDIIIDSQPSLDADLAVQQHDIEGGNAVRGLFDGRLRGFLSGPE